MAANNVLETAYLAVERMAGWNCASPPKPMLEYESREPQKDRDTGLPMYQVGVTVRNADSDKAYVINVRVAGEPVGVTENTIVKVYDLTATYWDRDGRSGVTYRASAITPATAPAPAAAATPAPAASSAPDTAVPGRTGGAKAGAS